MVSRNILNVGYLFRPSLSSSSTSSSSHQILQKVSWQPLSFPLSDELEQGFGEQGLNANFFEILNRVDTY